jgi:acyl-coenzyme A thioesterase PaaI-like protein
MAHAEPNSFARLDGTLFGEDQLCFGCGPRHPNGFRLSFVRDGDGVLTRFTPNDLQQGPPGIMHGGLVSTVADEVAAWALVSSLGKFGFTASFSCKFHLPVRVGIETEARAHLTKTTTRLVRSAVRISQKGRDCYTAEFTFVLLDKHSAEKLLEGPLPEAWLRFCR